MRVSNQWIVNTFLRRVAHNTDSLVSMQSKISTGMSYIKASENPVSNAVAMQHKTEIYENTQFIRNMDHTKEWYDNTTSAMMVLESAMQRARELAVQGANDTLVQEDRDAIAREIDELLLHIVDIGNTEIGGQYLFAGTKVDQKPFEIVTGETPGYNTSIVTYSFGEVRDDINVSRPIGIIYHGNDQRVITEIERGVIVDKSIHGEEVFFENGNRPIPGFIYELPPLGLSLPLDVLNEGRGVQAGIIIITDHNGVDHEIDLRSVARLDDVLGIINEHSSFSAGIEEKPSQTALALGLYRDAGNSSTLFGLSDPNMLYDHTPIASLNNGLGVPEGFLDIRSRNGNSYRVNINPGMTVADVVSEINKAGTGEIFKARFDSANRRIVIEDDSGTVGNFFITSVQTHIYIKDEEPHVAKDLNILQNAGQGSEISAYIDKNIDSESSFLSLANDGKGVERGYIDIAGRDGVTTRIDLTSVMTMYEVVDAINSQVIDQVAAFDPYEKRLIITDNSIPDGYHEFRIDEVRGTNPVTVREMKTVAKNLGLLKTTVGSTVVGDRLFPPGLNENSLLADIVPPPESGKLVLKAADHEKVELDLGEVETIGDLLDLINKNGLFNAIWDTSENRFVVAYKHATAQNTGLTIEESTNAARDLGFITNNPNHTQKITTGSPLSVKKMPTLTTSIDLNPKLTRDSELESLNSDRSFDKGVNLGEFMIQDREGNSLVFDIRGCKTLGEVMDLINSPTSSIFVRAEINAQENGIDLIDFSPNPTKFLEVQDLGGSAAFDLGIRGLSYDSRLVGKDLDPALTVNTSVTSLRGNCVGIEFGEIYVQSGEKSGKIDLSGVKTVGDIVDRISNSDLSLNMLAWISDDGKKINVTNTKDQPYIKFADVSGEPNTASRLGLASSPSIFTTLINFRDNLLRNDSKAISFETIQNIDDDLERTAKLHTEVGAKTNRVIKTKEKQEKVILNLREMLSVVEDLDITEAIMKMTQLEIAYQAALQTGAKIMQTTLLDFLR